MGHKDPTPSISSSDVSSTSTASIHKRSTPKIAAIIIVAFLVIASLAGVTVYFITSEKLLLSPKQENNDNYHQNGNLQDANDDFAEFFDDSISAVKVQEKRIDNNNYFFQHKITTEEAVTSSSSAPELPTTETYASELLYDDVTQPRFEYRPGELGERYKGRLGIPSTPNYKLQSRKIQPGPRFRNGMNVPKHFTADSDPEGPPYLQYEDVVPTRDSHALSGGLLQVDENKVYQVEYEDEIDEDVNMLLNLEGIGIFGEKVEEEITEEPSLQLNRANSQPGEVQQRFFESGMRADPYDSAFQRPNVNLNPQRRRFRPRLHHSASPQNLIRPRGGPGPVLVSDTEASLAVLDRRPNRPLFHHMGPPPGSHLRINQMIGKRMGGMVENMQEIISLAKNEVGLLRELAKNITDSGKELNLWEIMDAVNSTVADNPDSGIGKLMKRFYANYLADENEPALTPEGTYEKSLSSLIFLSFGIFLLNSVNEHLAQNESQQENRGFANDNVLQRLMQDHEALGQLFTGRSIGQPAGSSASVNNYLRLLMNLMNIYESEETDRHIDCVWQLYCHQLNAQAELGGMAATVAKINSVGMKLVLERIPGNAAVPAVFRSLIHYQQLDCPSLFPNCGLSS